MKIVDVRGLTPKERQEKVKKASLEMKNNEDMEIVSDDPRMLQLAPKIIEMIGGLKLVDVKQGEDKLFHTYVKKS